MNWFKRMKFVLLTVDKHWMKQQTWRKWAGAGAGASCACACACVGDGDGF